MLNNSDLHSKLSKSARGVSSEVVALLFKGSNIATISTFVVAAMLLSLLSAVITIKAAIIWITLMLLAYGQKVYLVTKFQKNESNALQASKWLMRFNISTLFCGLAWGSASLIIFPHNNTLLQALLALVLAGISAGSLIAYAIRTSTALAFVGGIAILTVPAFLIQDSPYAKEIILPSGFFVIFVAMASRMLAQGLLDNIALRINADTQSKAISDLSQRQSLHMEHTPMGVIEWDADLNITSWNKACTSIFGYQDEEIVGKHISFLIADLEGLSTEKALELLLSQEIIQNNLKKVAHKNGDAIFCEWHYTVLKGSDKKIIGLASLVQDKTAFIKSQNKIHQLAYYDALTNLPNRGLLLDRLNQVLSFSERSQSYGMVVYINLDHFKSINDAKGHAAGDHLLITIANRLQKVARKQDTVARIGGDEFVLVDRKSVV